MRQIPNALYITEGPHAARASLCSRHMRGWLGSRIWCETPTAHATAGASHPRSRRRDAIKLTRFTLTPRSESPTRDVERTQTDPSSKDTCGGGGGRAREGWGARE